MTSKIQFRVRKTADGYEGMFILPASVASIAQTRKRMYPSIQIPRAVLKQKKRIAVRSDVSDTPAGALSQAADGALALLKNPLIKAAMPPQAQAALKAAGMAADFIKSGKPEEAIRAAGKIGKSIVNKLKFW